MNQNHHLAIGHTLSTPTHWSDHLKFLRIYLPRTFTLKTFHMHKQEKKGSILAWCSLL